MSSHTRRLQKRKDRGLFFICVADFILQSAVPEILRDSDHDKDLLSISLCTETAEKKHDEHRHKSGRAKGVAMKTIQKLSLGKTSQCENSRLCHKETSDNCANFGSEFDNGIIPKEMSKRKNTQYSVPNCGDIKRRALIAFNTKNRYGAQHEAEYLQQQLEGLDFEIEQYIDFRAEEFLSELEDFCKEKAQKTSILLIFVMSHGSWGRVHDRDDRWININEIQEPMTRISRNIPKILIIQACQGGLHKSSRNYDGRPSAANSQPVTARSTDVHMLDVDMAVIMSTLWGQISARQFFIPILSDVLKEAADEPMEITDIYHKVCSIMTGPERTKYVKELRDESVNSNKPIRYAVGEPSRHKVMQIPCMLSTLRKQLIIGRYASDTSI